MPWTKRDVVLAIVGLTGALAVMVGCFAILVGWQAMFGPDCSGLFTRFAC